MSLSTNFPAIRPSLNLDFANTKTLDPRITFTRSTTATYYDGVTTAMAEQNLLTYSQDFDNVAWTKQGCTATANAATAPDGTTTAESVIASNGANAYSGAYRATPTSTTQTISFYVKAGNKTIAFIITSSGAAGNNAWFNLGTGLVGTKGANITSSSIQSVGNSWYRISITRPWVTGNIGVYFSDTDNSTTCTGDGVTVTGYIWGAQFEDRSSATAYTPTTTQPITNYIPVLQTAASGVARFDHNPTTGESLGLLIEEQRTNLLTYSDQFDNAVWSKTRSSITANTVVAPDGTLNGDKLVEDTTATSSHELAESVSGLTAQVYTFSVYAKAAGRSVLQITFSGNGGSGYANFDLSSGVLGTVGNSAVASITSVGNGWYRCSIASGSAFSAGSCTFAMMPQTSTTAARYGGYTGDGYSGIYIWGAQIEAGSFPTSYIPTTSAQVTRSADAASMTGTNFSSWFNAGEGALYAEANFSALFSSAGNPGTFVGISDGTTSNRLRLKAENGSVWEGATSGVSQFAIGTVGSPNNSNKMIGAYKVNDFAYSLNGGVVATDTLCTVPVVTQMQIGNLITTREFTGTIKKIAYYPARLTNAQLQGLTS